MPYNIKVVKTPENFNGRKKMSSQYISQRGIFCKLEKAGLFTRESALRWINQYLEKKEDGFEFEIVKSESTHISKNFIRGELLPDF
jgi:hypothetical protein